MISRVSPKCTLADIFKMVCVEKNLDPYKYELHHPYRPDEALNMASPLGDYQLAEITVVPVGQCIQSLVFIGCRQVHLIVIKLSSIPCMNSSFRTSLKYVQVSIFKDYIDVFVVLLCQLMQNYGVIWRHRHVLRSVVSTKFGQFIKSHCYDTLYVSTCNNSLTLLWCVSNGYVCHIILCGSVH